MASNSSNMTAVGRGGTGTTSTPANNVDGRRRSSQSGGGLFSGLMNQKRNSTDATATARRQSFADQKPATGIIGQMWNSFTTGSQEKK